MANTYTSIYIHLVFAVKWRLNLISKEWKDDLYKYISGIVAHKNQKLMIINGMPDHLHLLLSINQDCVISDLVRDIKSNSSKWINQNNLVKGRFEWQSGFGVFSISHFDIKKIIKYVENQETHHASNSFRVEYTNFLKSHEVDFKNEYLFEFS